SSNDGFVGVEVYRSGADGAATISGPGSSWTNSGNLLVGGGTGEFDINALLTIEDGGTVSSVDGRIGYGGTVTVTGSGSSWTNTGEVDLSYKGLVAGEKERYIGVLNIGAYDGSDTAGTVTASRITTSVGSGTLNFNQTDDISFAVPIDGNIYLNQRGS